MVVEFLTFSVEPSEQPAWLDVEERTWSRFLERQTGFVSKQMWIDHDAPARIHAVITWTDEASWKAIPDDELARVDAEMGDWFRTPTMRVFDVVRSC